MTDNFTDFCKRVAKNGLVTGCSGNVSKRVSNGMFITAKNEWIESIEPTNVVYIDDCMAEKDKVILLGNEPPDEWLVHKKIYKHRPDVHVIIHCQSPWATLIACTFDVDGINYNIIPEVPQVVGLIGTERTFYRPDSKELAEVVGKKIESYNVIQLANHGQFVVGKSYLNALHRAVVFESACRIVANFHNKNNIKTLSPADAIELCK